MSMYKNEIMGLLGIAVKNEQTDLLHATHQQNIHPPMPTEACIPTYYTANYHYQAQQSIGNSTTIRSSLYQQHSVEEVLDLSRRSHSLGSSRTSSTPSPHNAGSSESGSHAASSTSHQQQSPKIQAKSAQVSPPAIIPANFPHSQTYYLANNCAKNEEVPSSTTIASSAQSHLTFTSQQNYSAAASVLAPVAAIPVPISQISPALPTIIQQEPIRSFKSLPADPLVLAARFESNDSDSERYAEFRELITEGRGNTNYSRKSNPKRRRTNSLSSRNSVAVSSENEERIGSIEGHSDCDSSVPNATANSSGPIKDAAYLERRRKNNAAAKKSRDRRRAKEDQLATRAYKLEEYVKELRWKCKEFQTENRTLRAQLAIAQAELVSYKLRFGQ